MADADAMRRRFAAIDVAVKNQDNREHDIFDSDDYLQDHGGMIATIRSLTGRDPKAWFGDSANPARPVVRSPGRGGGPGRPHPGGEPQVDRGHAAPRLQGRLRDGRHRRLPVRLRRHRPGGRRLDVRTGDGSATWPTPRCGSSSSESNPWALRSIAERLLEADERGMWDASPEALDALRAAVLEAEGLGRGPDGVNYPGSD